MFLPAAHAADAPRRKVLIVGIDGLRPDALAKAEAPRLHALIKQGAYSADAQCESTTISGPNWATIMTGVHQYKHGVDGNDYKSDALKNYPDFFTYLEKHNPEWVTVRLLTWDSFHEKHPTGADLALYHNMGNNGDQVMTDQAVALLAGTDPRHKVDPDVLFIYYGNVDVVGHSKGFHPQVPEYLQAIATVDQQVGALLDAVQSRPHYADERWLILMTSDHGGALDRSHAGSTEDRRTIPFLVAGPLAAPGPIFPAPMNVDVARTVLAYMGVPIDPAWDLDGHAVGLAPSAPPKVEYGKNVVFNGDAEYNGGLPQERSNSYDLHCSGWRDEGPRMMTILRYQSDGPSTGRLTPASAGAPDVGKYFFAGGPSQSPVSRMSQTIDLSPLAEDIDAGKVQMTLSALLGGWRERNDVAVITARLHDASGFVIGTNSVGPVSARDRDGKTALLPREETRDVTPGARTVTVEVLCLRHTKGNRGDTNAAYVDNVSLVFSPRPVQPKK